jgi:dimeric dUTPase (all-alpha-NTP-PPase superfamily)
MDLTPLFEKQKELDERIKREHNLSGKQLMNERVLALLVELGELANETRCFKFWSLKPPSPREVQIEEFVDGVHFILSLGNEIRFKFSDVDTVFVHNCDVYSMSNDLIEQFNNVFESVTNFKDEHEFKRNNDEFEAYEELLYSYFGLGQMLGFTWEEVVKAYERKNAINHERQSSGY